MTNWREQIIGKSLFPPGIGGYQPIEPPYKLNPPKGGTGESKIDFLEAVQVLKIKKGDLIVLMIEKKLTEDAMKSIQQSPAIQFLKDKTKAEVMILEEGTKIGVIRTACGKDQK